MGATRPRMLETLVPIQEKNWRRNVADRRVRERKHKTKGRGRRTTEGKTTERR